MNIGDIQMTMSKTMFENEIVFISYTVDFFKGI